MNKDRPKNPATLKLMIYFTIIYNTTQVLRLKFQGASKNNKKSYRNLSLQIFENFHLRSEVRS